MAFLERSLIIALLLTAACRRDDITTALDGGAGAGGAGAGGSSSSGSPSGGAAGDGGGGGAPLGDVPSFRIGAWNLHNFSPYGTSEFRIGDIAAKITELDPDILAVEELKVAEGSEGEGPQAWDALLETLDGYEGLHNPWNTFDTTVGLLYDPTKVTLIASRALFEDDSYAFPRPPLEVEVQVSDGDKSFDLTVIVLHFKAFADSVDRRRAACAALDEYLQQKEGVPVVMLGDLNDDPYDVPADNAFTGTFLDAAPRYHFLTEALPPESVTSLGYHHFVDGMQIEGEFLDHVIVTSAVAEAYGTPQPEIHGVPESGFSAWESQYSDHFPLMLELGPSAK